MAILVTGGAGYIGSHTCVELLNDNKEIVVVDNFSNSKPIVINRIKKLTGKDFVFYNIDLLDKHKLDKIFLENKIEAVIHFAGFKAVGESVNYPIKYYNNNITSTLNLCKVMEQHNVYKLIFSSSATVYGTTNTMPIREDSKLNATNPYGKTKLIIEGILHDLYISNQNWKIMLLRYFNPIGAHESGLIGEDPNGKPNNLMPYITKVALGKLEKLNIYGNDYDTIDGTGIRDYIHVVDLANGHIKALDKLESSSGVQSYNLGTGRGFSVLEVIDIFEKSTGKIVPYSIVERRPGDVAVCYADATKSYIDLGWKTIKNLNDMCNDSWRWQINNPNGYDD